jgi:hypothetical protein
MSTPQEADICIDIAHNRTAAKAMFNDPDKVWQNLAKLQRGVSLLAK